MTTSFYVEYDFEDATARQDATQTRTNFNNVANSNGVFSGNPTVTITFTTVHTSIGLTLVFGGTNPVQCSVAWFNSEGTQIKKNYFDITSNSQFIGDSTVNYQKIVIEFTKGVPYRRVILNDIIYGIIKTWDENTITSGTLVENFDMISDKLPINQLSFSITDIDGDFNLGNTKGLHRYIQPQQIIKPYEYIQNVKHYLGRYFLDKYSEDKNLVKFTAVNYAGILDKVQFYQGDVYNGITAKTLIDKIMSVAGITSYTIDPQTQTTLLYGALPPMTCRQALREVLFACRSVVNISRNDEIEIYKRENTIIHGIGIGAKISTKATKKEYVSGVTINYNKYEASAEQSDILTASYPEGDNLIQFNSPYTNVTSNVGTIKERGKYYILLHLDSSAEVTLQGYGYTSNSLSITQESSFIESGEAVNIKAFSSALANDSLARLIAAHVLDYYNYRLQLDIQYLASDEVLKNWCEIENPDDRYDNYVAGFESITTNLTGGFISNAKLAGYYSYAFDYYYAGEELYGDDNFII